MNSLDAFIPEIDSWSVNTHKRRNLPANGENRINSNLKLWKYVSENKLVDLNNIQKKHSGPKVDEKSAPVAKISSCWVQQNLNIVKAQGAGKIC